VHKSYTEILQISGDVITVEAETVGYNEIAQITTSRGVSLAQVIRLDGKRVYLQVFAGSKGISTNDRVRFLGHPMRVASGDELLGRIFNGSGLPRDKRPSLTEHLIDIGTPSVNPVKRIIPRKMIRTGIPMIDVFNSLVESQKLPIFLSPASRITNCWRGLLFRRKSISLSSVAWALKTTIIFFQRHP